MTFSKKKTWGCEDWNPGIAIDIAVDSELEIDGKRSI